MGAGASMQGGYNVAHKELMATLQVEASKPLDASDIADFEAAKKELSRIRQMMIDARTRLTSDKQVIKRYEKKELTLEDGTHVVHNEDGSKVVTKPNGTIVETFADDTVTQTNPNGVKITQRPDGTVFQEHPDKSSIEKRPDGVMIHTSSAGERLEVHPDGSKKQTMGDGTTVQRYADGTSIQINPDGCKIVLHPDGSKMQHNPNGTIIETHPDGYKVQTMVDGSKFEFFANGTRIDTHASGEVIETHADGTTLRRKITTTVTINCTQCRTIINVSQGKYIVSCPICRHIMLAAQTQTQTTPGGLASVDETKGADGDGRVGELKLMFKRYDQDCDDFIDAAELGTMLEALNFPPTAFPEIFKATGGDAGKLNFDAFSEYVAQLQKKMVETAQAPMVEMTKTLLSEQKNELEAKQRQLQEENRRLQEKVAKGEAEEAELSEKEANEKMLKNIAAEYEAKSEQLHNAIAEQKRRTQELLKQRVQRRKSSARPGNSTSPRPQLSAS